MEMRIAAYLAVGAMLMATPASAHAQATATGTAPHLTRASLGHRRDDNRRLFAAAQSFAHLTKTAFAAPLATLRRHAAKAERMARAVRDLVPDARRPDFDVRLDNVRIALQARDRADVARAAIQCYRALVDAMRGHPDIPRSLDLMTYAGLRYRADLDSVPTRWQDMSGTSAFARTQWDALAPRVRGTDLRMRIEQSVNGMQIAVNQHNSSLAKLSANLELHLMGDLRMQFTVRHARIAME